MIAPLAWMAVCALCEPGSLEVEEPVAVDPAARQPSIGAMPDALLDLALDVRDLPLPDRMAAVSEALLGLPYLSDPMGEGRGVDGDPFARYDAFDCLTYTEEVLALAMAGDPAHAAAIRSSLRYGEGIEPDYVRRRHFMELQWIPGVVADGWLRDTTAEYGPVVVLDKEVTAATWEGWRPRARFAHTDEQLPIGAMRLEVLTLDAASEAADDIRPGSVVLTVRTDRAGVPIWVTHVSFVVTNAEGAQTMRHATKIGTGGTRDHDLAWYIDHLRTYDKWPVLGLSILEPVEPGPRRAALGGEAASR